MDKILLLTQKAYLFNSWIITTTSIELITMIFYSPVKQVKDYLIAQQTRSFLLLFQVCHSCSMCISSIKTVTYIQLKVRA